MKIAEEPSPPKQEGFGRALRAMGTAAVGGAVGMGTAELLARKMKFFNPTSHAQADSRRNAARIILPILSGAAVMLADRYRQRLNEEYGKTRGYDSKK